MSETSITRDGLMARLDDIAEAIIAVLGETTANLALALQARVLEGMPDSGGPLGQSIAIILEQNDAIASATLGSDLPYAGVEEYGFSGVEQVREHLRTQSMVFGRNVSPREVLVRAHDRNVTLPGHAFLESPLEEMAGDIEQAYESAIMGVLQS